MKFSHQWLREWVDVGIQADELAQQLTAVGLEVDEVTPLPTLSDRIVVAKVLSVRDHPNADNLRLCAVQVAPDVRYNIVCGATNVAAGMRVPLAKTGARIPLGRKIKKSKIRGEISEGMLCSAAELGLGDDADGILALPDDAPVGISLNQYLTLDDTCLNISLTPNRGDCSGLIGIAREVGVIHRLPLREPDCSKVPAIIDDTLPIELLAAEECPRYVGRIIRNMDATAPTPLWMRERLRRSGVRPISAVVDITNYVMLELGQPMHAFDLGCIQSGILVRHAVAGEKLVLLDGVERVLDQHSLVIADQAGAVALAGIMGGLDTAVSENTVDLLLEAAWFSPSTVFKEARRSKPKLNTDAAYRFERFVATDGQERTLERATRLLLQITGGRPGPIFIAEESEQLPRIPTISLRRQRIQRLLGVEVADERVKDILTRLGVGLKPTADGWMAQPPAFRPDLRIEADLIEEIVRIDGYDKLPATVPQAALTITPPRSERMPDRLIHRGYQEVITYSFVDPAVQRRLEPDVEPVALRNPIASDLAVMRTSLWPGLISALQHNLNRQQRRVRLFESGRVFRDDRQAGSTQPLMIGGLAYGQALPEQWGAPEREGDFFDLKTDLLTVFPLSVRTQLKFDPCSHPALDPGQSAQVMYNDQMIALIGALHPRHTEAFRISHSVWLFEARLEAVSDPKVPRFEPLSRYPMVRRDLSIIVAQAVSVQEIYRCILEAEIACLQAVECFDVYQGQGSEPNAKSLALALSFRDQQRTLSDEEINISVESVMSTLAQSLGAEQRGIR